MGRMIGGKLSKKSPWDHDFLIPHSYKQWALTVLIKLLKDKNFGSGAHSFLLKGSG